MKGIYQGNTGATAERLAARAGAALGRREVQRHGQHGALHLLLGGERAAVDGRVVLGLLHKAAQLPAVRPQPVRTDRYNTTCQCATSKSRDELGETTYETAARLRSAATSVRSRLKSLTVSATTSR